MTAKTKVKSIASRAATAVRDTLRIQAEADTIEVMKGIRAVERQIEDLENQIKTKRENIAERLKQIQEIQARLDKDTAAYVAMSK